MANVIQMKHGEARPTAGNLKAYEFGFCTGENTVYTTSGDKVAPFPLYSRHTIDFTGTDDPKTWLAKGDGFFYLTRDSSSYKTSFIINMTSGGKLITQIKIDSVTSTPPRLQIRTGTYEVKEENGVEIVINKWYQGNSTNTWCDVTLTAPAASTT